MNKISLDAIARELQKKASTAGSGRAAETVYGGHEKTLRQTVIALIGGIELTEHENPGEATVLVLAGRVRLVSAEVAWEGRRGDLLTVPAARHSLLALEDASVLLTVVKLQRP
jgi:quercetin dioxygenase-like cupin family protein